MSKESHARITLGFSLVVGLYLLALGVLVPTYFLGILSGLSLGWVLEDIKYDKRTITNKN